MGPDWSKNVIETSTRQTRDQALRFIQLVSQAEGNCAADVARVLMKTFSAQPDHGTQESVIGALATAEHSVRIAALLEELPRLMREAPEWAEVLVGHEVDRRPGVIAEVARTGSQDSIEALRTLLSRSDFRDFYPNATQVKI